MITRQKQIESAWQRVALVVHEISGDDERGQNLAQLSRAELLLEDTAHGEEASSPVGNSWMLRSSEPSATPADAQLRQIAETLRTSSVPMDSLIDAGAETNILASFVGSDMAVGFEFSPQSLQMIASWRSKLTLILIGERGLLLPSVHDGNPPSEALLRGMCASQIEFCRASLRLTVEDASREQIDVESRGMWDSVSQEWAVHPEVSFDGGFVRFCVAESPRSATHDPAHHAVSLLDRAERSRSYLARAVAEGAALDLLIRVYATRSMSIVCFRATDIARMAMLGCRLCGCGTSSRYWSGLLDQAQRYG